MGVKHEMTETRKKRLKNIWRRIRERRLEHDKLQQTAISSFLEDTENEK